MVIPALATTVWLLAKLGIGDPELHLLRAIRVTALFAGVATLITAGGVGRLAAQASIDALPAMGSPARHEEAEAASRRRPLIVAAKTFAVAGAGLTIIAVIPHAHVPESVLGWLAIAVAGAFTGAVCGVVIGAVCGGTNVLDVMALARWPTEVLRQLLEPEDLAAATKSRPRKRRITFPFLFGPRPEDTPPPAPAASPSEPDPAAAGPAEPGER